MNLYPVILSGGAGTRLWPMSRAAMPKQFLPLVSERSLLQETLQRLEGLPDLAPPLMVCNDDHRFLVAEQLRAIGVRPQTILLEPVGRNTAPAVAAAAHAARAADPEALLLVLPADHVIRDVAAFHAAVGRAVALAARGALVTFGIVPATPETGYGYIQRGAPVPEREGCFAVARFVEKPDRARAEAFLASGDFYWNSGMFLFKASRYLEELERLQPAMAKAAAAAVQNARHDLDFCRLDAKDFGACPADSIDYAVMEHTDAAAVVPVDMGWNDIGSWSALWEIGAKDAAGNVCRGDVYADGASRCYVTAENRAVVAIGVDDLVVVETADVVLVAHRDRAQDVKQAVEHFKAAGRTEHLVHRRVYRPWGHYEGIDAGERFQVKRITVSPGQKLSLQMHHHRAEHWVVVSGTARVVRDDEEILLSENQSTYIPLGVTHRLENPGLIPLHMIEVQSGAYLGEDDIVRFEDLYRRGG